MKILFSLFLLASSFFSNSSRASNTITFGDTSEFIDFKKRFSRIEKDGIILSSELSKYINKMTEKTFKNSETLKLHFNNIDIAGAISNGHYSYRQVERGLDRSLLDFDYIFYDKDGTIIKEGHVVLSDHLFHSSLRKSSFRIERSYLKYELILFNKWLSHIVQ